MEQTLPLNPFEYGRPIINPTHFFGRQSELNHIQDACHKLLSVSVVGERRAGKSSLLRQFTVPEVVETLCEKLVDSYLANLENLQ